MPQATVSPVRCSADLRTPRSTFDTFRRAILAGQPGILWEAIDPDLRMMMQRRHFREGGERFFQRMRSVVACLSLGEPSQIGARSVSCPVLQGGRQVAVAWFQFTDRSWLLKSLS